MNSSNQNNPNYGTLKYSKQLLYLADNNCSNKNKHQTFIIKLFLIFALTLAAFLGRTQNIKIETLAIWELLYPKSQIFDKSQRLVTQVTKQDGNYEYRSEIVSTHYYSIGKQQKAFVVLFKYMFGSPNDPDGAGQKAECHHCYPEIELATFTLDGNTWRKEKFVTDWEESTGLYGKGPAVSFAKVNSVDCLVLTESFEKSRDDDSIVKLTIYYDINTLKKVETISPL